MTGPHGCTSGCIWGHGLVALLQSALEAKVQRLSTKVKDQQKKLQKFEQQAFSDGKKIHDLREALAQKDTDMAPTLQSLEWHKKELATLKAEANELCKTQVLNWQIRAEQAERTVDELQRELRQRDVERERKNEEVEDSEQV